MEMSDRDTFPFELCNPQLQTLLIGIYGIIISGHESE